MRIRGFMKRKYLLLVLITFLGFIRLSAINVQALNYTPAVKEGDELIWETEVKYEGTMELSYEKHKITIIEDYSGYTRVRADLYTSVDNVDYIFSYSHTLGFLRDYNEYPTDLIDSYIIIPRTKVADYIDQIESILGDEYNLSPMKNGYGIKIKWTDTPQNEFTWVYSPKGILESWSFRSDEENVEKRLFSINGRHYYSIPGYPIYFLIGFSLSGLLGVFFLIKHRVVQT
jgi:hypothetical protein